MSNEQGGAPASGPGDLEKMKAALAGAGGRSPAPEMAQTDIESISKLKSAFDNIKKQLTRVIVGQDLVIEELLIALFSKGHCMLEGVPGLAKTLMISTLSRCLSLEFSRIQFTPDLM